MNLFLRILFILFSLKAFSQDTLMPTIFLDDIIISEENNGFSKEDFFTYVKNDTTFYMGFKHLRYYSHNYESQLRILDKKGNIKGALSRKGKHYSDGTHAWILDDSLNIEGKIYKRNGTYRFYTPKAFEEVFFPKDTINVSLKISSKKNKRESQNMRDAKTVGFSVGSEETEQNKLGLRKKLAIFSAKMQQYYNYILSDTIYNNKDCYVFTVQVKNDSNEDKVLIKKLTSFFDKENFNVIYREYKFDYNHLLFNIDMDIIVHMDYIDNIHVPVKIYYKGIWNIMFFRPERAEFILSNTNYLIH